MVVKVAVVGRRRAVHPGRTMTRDLHPLRVVIASL